jgi:S1-C subfamily serine protease
MIGDAIVEVNGESFGGPLEIMRLIKEGKTQKRIEFSVLRDSQRRIFVILLDGQPGISESVEGAR